MFSRWINPPAIWNAAQLKSQAKSRTISRMKNITISTLTICSSGLDWHVAAQFLYYPWDISRVSSVRLILLVKIAHTVTMTASVFYRFGGSPAKDFIGFSHHLRHSPTHRIPILPNLLQRGYGGAFRGHRGRTRKGLKVFFAESRNEGSPLILIVQDRPRYLLRDEPF
jgi:hypothetical protein